jgi:hypothetical protein
MNDHVTHITHNALASPTLADRLPVGTPVLPAQLQSFTVTITMPDGSTGTHIGQYADSIEALLLAEKRFPSFARINVCATARRKPELKLAAPPAVAAGVAPALAPAHIFGKKCSVPEQAARVALALERNAWALYGAAGEPA